MSRLSLYLSQLLSGMVAMTLGPVLNTMLDGVGIPLAQGGTPALTYFFATMVGILSLKLLLARVPVKWCLFGWHRDGARDVAAQVPRGCVLLDRGMGRPVGDLLLRRTGRGKGVRVLPTATTSEPVTVMNASTAMERARGR